MSAGAIEFDGVVLAAGRSRRMGRDKATLEVAGMPLWQRQRDVLRQAGAKHVFASVRDDQPWTQTATGFDAFLYDALPDGGPLVGVTAALERATCAHLAVLAIDLPQLPVMWFDRLGAGCAPGCGTVAQRGGCFEPLAVIYPRELKWLAWEAIACGQYGFQPLLREAVAKGLMKPLEITEADEAWFVNWNTADAVR
jgi:molybdopterin-guanine dinucleotide biosynthesis protein A